MTNTPPEGMTILIVDDHDAMRSMLREHVQSAYPECTVLEAATGADAVAACRKRRPRLILMDIGLPDIGGIELIASLRELAPGAAVIVVSQHTGRIYVERTRAAGACAYVTKDRIFHDLPGAMARALSAAPGAGDGEAS